jgi:hypothetical protein
MDTWQYYKASLDLTETWDAQDITWVPSSIDVLWRLWNVGITSNTSNLRHVAQLILDKNIVQAVKKKLSPN